MDFKSSNPPRSPFSLKSLLKRAVIGGGSAGGALVWSSSSSSVCGTVASSSSSRSSNIFSSIQKRRRSSTTQSSKQRKVRFNDTLQIQELSDENITEYDDEESSVVEESFVDYSDFGVIWENNPSTSSQRSKLIETISLAKARCKSDPEVVEYLNALSDYYDSVCLTGVKNKNVTGVVRRGVRNGLRGMESWSDVGTYRRERTSTVVRMIIEAYKQLQKNREVKDGFKRAQLLRQFCVKLTQESKKWAFTTAQDDFKAVKADRFQQRKLQERCQQEEKADTKFCSDASVTEVLIESFSFSESTLFEDTSTYLITESKHLDL